jgi:SAM-dependent methyltransferase
VKIHPHGYWTGDDVAEHHLTSNALAWWIVGKLADMGPLPVYDFGCGTGAYLRHIREHLSFHACGEGSAHTRPPVPYVLHGFEGEKPKGAVFSPIWSVDLTHPFRVDPPGNALCLEVAEHVPAEREAVFLDNVCSAVALDGILVMSWAVRGQGGEGHVNCRNNAEAVDRIRDRGLAWDEDATAFARSVIDESECPWFRSTLLVFRR